MSDGEELVIYQLRVALEGISPLIWRRLLVPGDYSIADLPFITSLPKLDARSIYFSGVSLFGSLSSFANLE